MTKREAESWANVVRVLSGEGYGISRDDIEALRKIEMTLHRWAERECNGEVETDEDGKAYAAFDSVGSQALATRRRYRVPNREAGALRRLAAIMARYPHLRAYHQTDPRGCALYVYRADRVPSEGCSSSVCFCHDPTGRLGKACSHCGCAPVSIDSCYSSIGVAVCR